MREGRERRRSASRAPGVVRALLCAVVLAGASGTAQARAALTMKTVSARWVQAAPAAINAAEQPAIGAPTDGDWTDEYRIAAYLRAHRDLQQSLIGYSLAALHATNTPRADAERERGARPRRAAAAGRLLAAPH